MHADIYALTVIDDYRNVKLYSTMSIGTAFAVCWLLADLAIS